MAVTASATADTGELRLRDRTEDRSDSGRDTRSAIQRAPAEARNAALDGLRIELTSRVKGRRPCRRAPASPIH